VIERELEILLCLVFKNNKEEKRRKFITIDSREKEEI
jgi:hypothetical protein